MLGHVANLQGRRLMDMAAGERLQAQNSLDQRSFTSAVGADHRENIAPAYGQADLIDHWRVTERDRRLLQPHQRCMRVHGHTGVAWCGWQRGHRPLTSIMVSTAVKPSPRAACSMAWETGSDASSWTIRQP